MVGLVAAQDIVSNKLVLKSGQEMDIVDSASLPEAAEARRLAMCESVPYEHSIGPVYQQTIRINPPPGHPNCACGTVVDGQKCECGIATRARDVNPCGQQWPE